MKLKLLTGVIAASLFVGVAFGQNVVIRGKVTPATNAAQITLISDGETWTIKRTSTTTVQGTLKPGYTVTVRCKSPDAHKQE